MLKAAATICRSRGVQKLLFANPESSVREFCSPLRPKEMVEVKEYGARARGATPGLEFFRCVSHSDCESPLMLMIIGPAKRNLGRGQLLLLRGQRLFNGADVLPVVVYDCVEFVL
jgi:hypothetical protein